MRVNFPCPAKMDEMIFTLAIRKGDQMFGRNRFSFEPRYVTQTLTSKLRKFTMSMRQSARQYELKMYFLESASFRGKHHCPVNMD
jgi:hypothetical protein